MFMGDNPISEVELPPKPRSTQRNLTIVEAKTILRMMQYPEREIALITIATGMSISEICALQWKYVHLTGSAIYAEGKLIPPGSILVKKQWNATGIVDAHANRVRQVIVPEPLIQVLVRLRRRRKVSDQNSFVIGTREGNPIRPASVRMLKLKPIGRKLDMPWLSWECLKRANDVLLLKLRDQFIEELVLSARYVRIGHARRPNLG
jgi:integrase